MRQVFTSLLLLVLFVSCSNPLEKVYSEATLEKDIKEIKESGKADTTELMLIASSLIRSAMTGEKLEGKTYQQIIDEAKVIEAKAKEEERKQAQVAAHAKMEEEKRLKRLNQALTVSLFDKGFDEYSYEEYLTYKFAFKNNGDKDIRAFTGTVIFTDLFDKEIQRLNLTYDDGVTAGKQVNYNATTDYNQFIDEDKALRFKDLKDIKVVWKPEKIMLANGTVLE